MLAAMVGLGASPALAQPMWADDYPSYGRRYEAYRSYDEGLSQRAIARIIRSEGLNMVSRPVRRDGRYIVIANDPYGRPQRVVIDAESGDIIRITAARGDGPGLRERPPTSGRASPDFDRGEGPPPLPPLNRPRAAIPDLPGDELPPPGAAPERRAPVAAPKAQKPPAPKTAKVTPPATPPIPRPRPGDAPSANAGEPRKPSRVILPGGPVPKQDRTAGRAYAPAPAPAPSDPTPAAAPAETQSAPAPAPEAATPAPTEAAPAAPAPAEAAPAPQSATGQPDSRIPPAQSLE